MELKNSARIERDVTTETVTAVVKSLSAGKAEAIVSPYLGDFFIYNIRLLYYPYYRVYYEYRIKTFFGKGRIHKAICLVDMLNNIASTCDRFETELLNPDSETVLTPRISKTQAMKTADIYLTHSSINVMKALSAPLKVATDSQGIFKPFWLFHCRNSAGESMDILVDSNTGKYETL